MAENSKIAEIKSVLEFALEVVNDQALRFHQDCRCQLCESLPLELQKALRLIDELKAEVHP